MAQLAFSFKKTALVFATLVFSLPGCQSPSVDKTVASPSTNQNAGPPDQNAVQRMAELQIVDCLLPGQQRMLGNSSYLTPRRPIKTTAADCSIRGGEYVAYDRADYKTALNVWLPTAEAGDADAQANVGEIFERGAGAQPNYDAALIWYRKAAEQGNRRAQFNLGTFYEQGLGVERDPVAALNWYRSAWGVPADEIGFKSYWEKTAASEREQLNAEIVHRDQQIAALEKQVTGLRKQVAQAQAAGSKQPDPALLAQIDSLQGLVRELSQQKQASLAKADTLQLRQPMRQEAVTTKAPTADAAKLGNYRFGRFYALVIGDEQYEKIEPLKTPLNDVEVIGALLKNRYGFEVTQLRNADNVAIMEAINNLNAVLTEADNLLIYYAGHGSRTKSGNLETGYWLPVNADPPPRDTYWVSNDFVTRHISNFKAKRVLVVADSCFAGLLSAEPGYLLLGANGVPSQDYIRYKIDRRARLLLASGGDRPVLDSGGGQHSVFADAFINVLRENTRLLTGPELFREVRGRVLKSAGALQFQQEPVYKAIKGAGHEVGDFFFVPAASTASRF